MAVTKEQLTHLLAGPPVTDIDFVAEAVPITGAGYQKLIPKIASGQIRVVYDSSIDLHRARYHAESNGRGVHPLFVMGSLDAHAVILHELTHALIDNMHLSPRRGLSRSEDEAIGFIAQALYLIGSGRTAPHDPILGPPAFEIARSILSSRGRYSVTHHQMRRMRNAVAKHPFYGRSIRGRRAPSDGI
jgi:hypothetical protein